MMPSYGGSSSRTSSTPATASLLRPRVGRLISGLDDGDEADFVPVTTSTSTSTSTRIASPRPDPFDSSFDPKPIPSRHLPRSTSSSILQQDVPHVAQRGSPLRPRPSTRRDESPSLSLFFADSWNAIQGKASEMLGSATSSPVKTQSRQRTHTRKPSIADHPRNTSAPPAQWGVPSPAINIVGQGLKEDREAEIRALKRRDLLIASPDEHADSMGRFKRRSSDARRYESAPPGEHDDRDALVYLHHVKPDDTLAGISIKYNCKDAIIRRTNRMWGNDRPQVRRVMLIPVDSCGVKGKKLSHGQELDLLTGPESQSNNPFPTSSAPEVRPNHPTPTFTTSDLKSRPPPPMGRRRNESISTNGDRAQSSHRAHDPEHQCMHDSWVLLPNAKEPTEIARLSRRNLAYFPPARRKSQSYSDLDTPSTSLDLMRPPTLDGPALSPLREPAQRPRRGRKLSNATNGYFPSYLSGPGGVGTMGKNIKSPGPGQDGLNKLFASHLPNVAPPPNQQNLYLPDVPLYSDNPSVASSLSASGTQSPSGLGLDNVGGAIESWARKMASKARVALDAPDQKTAARASVGVPGRGADGLGDLIEMADQFEIGDHEDYEEEEEERGRQGSATMHINGRGMTNSASFGQQQDTLRERGRSGTSAGAGKRNKDD